jgi:hypothetical protein
MGTCMFNYLLGRLGMGTTITLFQLKICETDQIRALLLHVYRMGPMGLFQTVISGLIYFQIQRLSNVNLDKTCPNIVFFLVLNVGY